MKITFAHGASLKDPDKLFNNGLNGKKWRSIDLFKDDQINKTKLKSLIRSAVDYNHNFLLDKKDEKRHH